MTAFYLFPSCAISHIFSFIFFQYILPKTSLAYLFQQYSSLLASTFVGFHFGPHDVLVPSQFAFDYGTFQLSQYIGSLPHNLAQVPNTFIGRELVVVSNLEEGGIWIRFES